MVLYLLFIWRGMLWYVNHNSTWPLVVFNVNKILSEFLSAPRAVLYNWLYQIWLKSHAILTLNIYTEFFGILLIFVLLILSAGGEEVGQLTFGKTQTDGAVSDGGDNIGDEINSREASTFDDEFVPLTKHKHYNQYIVWS